MAGLNHTFHLLNVSEFAYKDYLKALRLQGGIEIYDDQLAYFADTLRWIPTYNPAREEPYQGLCWFGPTVIKTEGASIARRIFQAWLDLFANGPSILNLQGYMVLDDKGQATHERLEMRRDEIMSKLKTLADWCQQVAESEDRYFIMHLGI